MAGLNFICHSVALLKKIIQTIFNSLYNIPQKVMTHNINKSPITFLYNNKYLQSPYNTEKSHTNGHE